MRDRVYFLQESQHIPHAKLSIGASRKQNVLLLKLDNSQTFDSAITCLELQAILELIDWPNVYGTRLASNDEILVQVDNTVLKFLFGLKATHFGVGLCLHNSNLTLPKQHQSLPILSQQNLGNIELELSIEYPHSL